MYLEESSMRRWKGWDVLEGGFNERVKRLGCTCLRESSNEKWEGWDVLEGKV